MRIKRIEHCGIVVKDLAERGRFWQESLGLTLEGSEVFHQSGVEIALYRVGESMVELLCGTTPQSAYARLVREKGEGLHHLCLEVDNLDGVLEELKTRGIKLRDQVPRAGHQGSRIAFLDPESTGQVLIELVEFGPGHREGR